MAKSKSTRAKAPPSAGIPPGVRALLDDQHAEVLKALGIVGCAMNTAATGDDWADEIQDALSVALDILRDAANKLDPEECDLLQGTQP